MISGNIEKFNSPIRNITAKVELSCGGSTNATTSGNPIIITDAVDYAAPVDIQLKSKNLFPVGNFIFDLNKHIVFDTPLPANTPMTLSGIAESSNTDAPYMLIMAITASGSCIAYSQFPFNTGNRESITLKYTEPVVEYTFYAGTGWANAEGQTATYTDFQVELGTSATDYMPYDDLTGVEVIRTGKNLFPIGTFDFERITTVYLDFLIPANTPMVIALEGATTNPNQDGMLVSAIFEDGSSASGGEATSYTPKLGGRQLINKTFSKPVKGFYLYAAGSYVGSGGYFGSYKDFQVELGTEATAYEPYRGCQVAAANSEGVVEGITSLAPTTTLIAPGCYMTATYEQPITGNNFTINHDDDLVSIIVDRMGEGKFFGYGVGQKIEVKTIDIDRTYDIGTQHSLKAYFDDVNVLPTFYVKETKRDENTNGLTITAYDALEKASTHYTSELVIESETPTIREYAEACAAVLELGIQAQYEEFDFVGQANIEGSETIRDFLNDIAEATQTIYYISQDNTLTFKRLDIEGSPVYTVDKSKYFTLKTEPQKTLTTIVSATELGDNIEATTGPGEKQYVRDNAFWTLALPPLEDALAAIGGLTLTPFDCSWRGNYLLEIGDKIALVAKDDNIVETYYLNDRIRYEGGLKQTTQLIYVPDENSFTNPITLGDSLKQTFAKVDKQNKQIDIVVSEQKNSNSQISSISANLDSLSGTVSSTANKLNDIDGSIETLTKRVDATITEEDLVISVRSELANGVDKVKTKEKNFTFDDEGLSITSSENNLSTTITEDGMRIHNDRKEVLSANNEGVQAIDLHATTYLIIGKNSRFEDFGSNRTACFFIGG